MLLSGLLVAACGEAPETGMFPEGDGGAADAADVKGLVDASDVSPPDGVEPDGSDIASADADTAGATDVAQSSDGDADTATPCPLGCENGGTCNDGVCECLAGWVGDVCDEPTCGAACADHGRCVAPNECQCDPGWFGIDCDVEGQRPVSIGATEGAIGSPLSEFGRVRDRETRREVRVSRAFVIHDTEMTRAEWRALSERFAGQRVLPEGMEGVGEDLPVTNITWWSAVAAANALSERDGLTPCYLMSPDELKECSVAGGTDEIRTTAEMWQAVFSGRIQCPIELPSRFQNAAGETSEMLECDGWRLPTDAEWEVAARSVAGTSSLLGSAMYDAEGRPADPAATPSGACDRALGSPLDRIAWWCGNTSGAPGPVRGQIPTSRGLYEVLGNVAEWVWDGYVDAPAGGADVRIDAPARSCQYAGLSDSNCRVRRGGTFAPSTESGSIPWRFAFRAPFGAGRQSPAVGVRWVRTGKL